MLLPMVASAYDIATKNADGITVYYNISNDGKELIVTSDGFASYKGAVIIPKEVTYMNITRKVISIGYRAFYCCGVSSVTIPNSVISIDNEAFSGCHSLTSVTIPNSVTTIGNSAFYNCSGLTSVTIPNSVTNIDAFAFYGCSGLTSVIIPNSVTNIGMYAFKNCICLTSVTIPNSVTNIGNSAFYGCSGLTSVTIPNSVTNIGYNAFGGVNYTSINSLIENPFRISGKLSNSSTFTKNTYNNATLYVPMGTIDKYKATAGWKDFANIVEGNPTGIEAVKNKQQEPVCYYTLDGRQINSPKSGTVVVKKQGKRIEKVLIK